MQFIAFFIGNTMTLYIMYTPVWFFFIFGNVLLVAFVYWHLYLLN